jgi:hypothetical protein
MCECRGRRMRRSDPSTAVPDAVLDRCSRRGSRPPFPTRFYLLHPLTRTASIRGGVPSPSMGSYFVARHPCRIFTRLPASESLLLAWPLCRGSGANGEASPKGGGQEPDVKRSNQEKGQPKAMVPGHPATAPCVALDGCSGRRSTSPIRGVVPRASMPSPARQSDERSQSPKPKAQSPKPKATGERSTVFVTQVPPYTCVYRSS